MVQVKRRGEENLTNDIIIEDTSIHNDQKDSQILPSVHAISNDFQNQDEYKMLNENNCEGDLVDEDFEDRNVKNKLYHSNIISDSNTQLNSQDEDLKRSEAMFAKTTQNNIELKQHNQTDQKECNDFSESTSTLTINPDAAFSQELLATAINYEVSCFWAYRFNVSIGNTKSFLLKLYDMVQWIDFCAYLIWQNIFLPNDQKMNVCQVFYINLDWNVI